MSDAMPVPPSAPAVTPPGPADTSTLSQRVRTSCLVILTICAVGAVLTVLKPIVTPLLIAIYLFFLVNPIITFFDRRRIPTVVAYTIVSLAIIMVTYGFGWIIDLNGRELTDRLPHYERRLRTTLDQYARMTRIADADGHFDWERYGISDLLPVSQHEAMTWVVETALDIVEMSTMSLFYLIFVLIEAGKLKQRTARSLEPDSAARVMQIADTINSDIWQYLIVKTAVSFGTGVTTAALGLMFGLDFYLLWGALMFFANYITYVGSLGALVPPIVLAFIQFNNPIAAATLAGMLVLARFLWIDYVELKYSGRHVNVSPLLLLFGLTLAGWMWGVVGMLLAVPLITSIRIALGSSDETRYMAELMSDE